MKKTVFAAALICLTGGAAWSFDMFDGKKPFSFKEMMKSFTSFFAASAPREVLSALPLNLEPAKAQEFLEQQKPVLIDIRTPDEYAQGHLQDAALMDFYAPDFAEKLGKLDKGVKYLIYCRSGKRSGKALETMGRLGFTDAHDIAGGINAWTAAGFPVVK